MWKALPELLHPAPSLSRKGGGTKDASYRRGLWAEALGRAFLRLKGYRILAVRYRTPVGEIDLVAVRGRVLAIVEVKARGSYRTGSEAISARQQERLGRAAGVFVARHPRYAGYDVRFDALVVAPWRWPEHVAGAWEGR